MHKRAELKITVAKLLELSYSKDRGMMTQLLLQKNGAKMTVDQNGQVRFSGEVGAFTFSGRPVLDQMGAKFRRLSVNFKNKEDMEIGYAISADMEGVVFEVSGSFDLEELITSCSGLLCQVARALKGRHNGYDRELQRIMGY